MYFCLFFSLYYDGNNIMLLSGVLQFLFSFVMRGRIYSEAWVI